MQAFLADLVQNSIHFFIVGPATVRRNLGLGFGRSEAEAFAGGIHLAQKVKEPVQMVGATNEIRSRQSTTEVAGLATSVRAISQDGENGQSHQSVCHGLQTHGEEEPDHHPGVRLQKCSRQDDPKHTRRCTHQRCPRVIEEQTGNAIKPP